MKVYISIPISGKPLKDTMQKADGIKSALSRKGYRPVSPFDIYCGNEPKYEDYLCHDLRAMMDCDAVYFCTGWEQSCGCNIEHDVAMRFKAYGKKDFKIMYEE